MNVGRKGVLALLLTPLFVSCAGGGGGSRGRDLDRYSIRYRTDVQGYHYALDYSAEAVVEALPGVYEHLGFPGGLASNQDDLLFISPTARAEGRIYPDERNSDYLDCGRGTSGPRADSYILEFVVVTRIVPIDPGGSEIDVIVDGFASDRYHNTNAVPCRGKGKLEGQVADLLELVLAGRVDLNGDSDG